VQHGRLIRLVSPVDGPDRSRAALAFVAPDRSRAVVFCYQLDDPLSPPAELRITGLDPDGIYTIDATDLSDEGRSLGTATAAALADGAVAWMPDEATTARVIEITRVAAPD